MKSLIFRGQSYNAVAFRTIFQRWNNAVNKMEYCSFLFPLIPPQLCRRHPEMLFDVFAEEGGVGEVEQVAYLFDTEVGIAEIITDFF